MRLSSPPFDFVAQPLKQRLAALTSSVALTLTAAAQSSRPNIIFIYSDDHAYQAISAYNDPRQLLQTPNIDRLAKEGMRFDRCCTTNSLCGPARATVLTGKYSHKNGFYNNAGDFVKDPVFMATSVFDNTQVTFPKLLQTAGYQTAVIGKWHLVSEPKGFDFSQILVGQGIYYNPPMILNGQPIKTEGYATTIITKATVDWLNHRDPAKPFMLMMQHKAPHRGWEPALEHLNFDNDRVYPEHPTLFDDYAGRGSAERNQRMTIAKHLDRDMRGGDDLKRTPPEDLNEKQLKVWNAYYEPRNAMYRAANPQGDAFTKWKYQRYMHDYLGSVLSIDDSVGELLRYLDEHDLAKNTIVIYSSDQGFFLGEHGWFDKRWIFQESMRTPLLVRWPDVIKPGSVNGDLVSNVDFAETFLDVAGIPIPSDMQGGSLVPIFRSQRPANWRDAFYYQYYEYPDTHYVAAHHGVVTDRYTLVQFDFPEKYTELFDLQKDPNQMTDVSKQPDYAGVKAELEAKLARLRKQLDVPDTITEAQMGPDPAVFFRQMQQRQQPATRKN